MTVGGATCKPSREVRIGDVIAVKRMPVVYQYKVLDLVTSRQPAKNVPAYCLNITPQEELDKLDAPRETIFVFRDRGTGRPTKKERRELRGEGIEIFKRDFPLTPEEIHARTGTHAGSRQRLAFTRIGGKLWTIRLAADAPETGREG